MIKKLSISVIISILLSFYPGSVAANYPGILIVKVKGQFRELQSLGEAELIFENTYRLKVNDVNSALSVLKSSSGIEYAERDARLTLEASASDPLFVLDIVESTKQWYLPKMKVNQAWDITRGSGITVAVVDTGINGKHEDLNDGRVIAGYVNYCQTPGSGTDCLVRITGETAGSVNSDDNGHGTIVAGIIGAAANNNKGIAGINWNVKLMPIKALDSQGSGFASDVALGIRRAADHGAKVINLSVGGPGLEGLEVLRDAIAYAFNKGVLVVAAAGNDAAVTGGNLNTNPVLPVCADGAENIVIGVAAVDIFDRKAKFSNYGSNCIDIAAPGASTFVDKQTKQGLVSTYFDPTKPGENNLYVYALGTSVAAPMVSGTAALMMSALPDLDIRAVRDRLIASVDDIDNANLTGCNGGSCVGQIGKGRLNALKAVQSVSTFSTGALIKSDSSAIFLVERGVKRPVSEFVFKQRFSSQQTTAATPDQLASLPTGAPVPPSDGTLVKEPSFPTVYLVEGGELRPLSLLAFVSRRFRFEDIVILPASELAGYKVGAEAAVLDGALVKTNDHPAVYALVGGKRQLVSFTVWEQRFAGQMIAVFTREELDLYPVAQFLYPPVDGTLIKGDADPTVFLIEGGKRRAINLNGFMNRGFSFVNVKVLPQTEIQAYETGQAIIE